MEYSALTLLKRVGYKDMFNYLYTHHYKDSISYEEIVDLDSRQRQFYEEIIVSQTEEVFRMHHIDQEKDLVVVASDIFRSLYSNRNPSNSLK